MFLLIADSGSTKTDWRLVAPDQTTRAIHTDGINPYYQTTEEIATVLQAQLLPGLPDSAVTSVFFYGAGCSGPTVNVLVADALRAVLPGLQTVDVNSDMLGAARAAAGREPGIVCILGTGSNACCYDGSQITRGIQSLGFWLGDEGSGGYLGKTLVRDFFQDRLPTDLRDAFDHRYALDRLTLLENAYKKPYPNRYFAGFTPFLSENIGHPHVVDLLTDAFVLFLSTYVRRFPEAGVWPVHFVGSVAHVFAEPLQQAVLRTGLTMGRILKAPAEQLVEYHQWRA
ncbi:N-acetylglucosamine kinase [Spirosoma utsteinense]|uniref:N-acetylglucosamine kinase-like BadF-type ATPase n=1 Tax=Spirosoma utsteinense TaxID=2585773 RepID=A0ABR6W4Q3_9BACT|nr:N-acetylglucosamine kinase [Spirosoma utsteinense]MBC3785391.1 N-acetylglucosamine kinase-like BadF-type ATPase [Spirosoma utsteinense]MBC3791581.1 N-acetylglucosamine kinase-like BadF-type ATPase [Spirosoma utsteinense]